MRHIHQREEWDCGLAVAAMLAGVPYATARTHVRGRWKVEGLHVAAMRRLLVTLSGHHWQISTRHYRHVLHRVPLPTGPAALIIRAPRVTGHYVAWDGERLYDPEFKRTARQQSYRRRHYYVCRILTPKLERPTVRPGV